MQRIIGCSSACGSIGPTQNSLDRACKRHPGCSISNTETSGFLLARTISCHGRGRNEALPRSQVTATEPVSYTHLMLNTNRETYSFGVSLTIINYGSDTPIHPLFNDSGHFLAILTNIHLSNLSLFLFHLLIIPPPLSPIPSSSSYLFSPSSLPLPLPPSPLTYYTYQTQIQAKNKVQQISSDTQITSAGRYFLMRQSGP